MSLGVNIENASPRVNIRGMLAHRAIGREEELGELAEAARVWIVDRRRVSKRLEHLPENGIVHLCRETSAPRTPAKTALVQSKCSPGQDNRLFTCFSIPC